MARAIRDVEPEFDKERALRLSTAIIDRARAEARQFYKIDRDVLVKMFAEGATTREVADHFSASLDRVNRIRRQEGIEMPGRQTVDDEELIALVAEGKTPKAIAEHFGVKRDTIIDHMRRAGVPSTNQGGQPRRVDRDEVRRLFEAGTSNRQVASIMNISRKTAERIKAELGLVKRAEFVPIPQETQDRAREMLEDGASYREVQRTLGLGDRWLRSHFPGMGFKSPTEAAQYRKMLQQLDSL
jgi:DNA-binding CsgD family transcriptional regulator